MQPMTDGAALLRALFDAGLEAALPDGKFAGRLPAPPRGRTIVLGAGKASARMAQAFEDAWPHPCEGLVVTRYGHGAATRWIEVAEAAHPVPDQAGVEAAQRILDLARGAGPDDLVVCLISGGASALLALPADGVSLADKQLLSRDLLRSGASIGEMNRVRRALSAIKGGRLALAAAPARLVTYLISDVPGDEPASIGSGPTIPERADPEEVLGILERYGIALPPPMTAAVRAGAAPPPADPRSAVVMLATPLDALKAAARKAEALGLHPLILGDALEGEAREVARALAGITRSAHAHDLPVPRPCVLLSGGETTVTVRGNGRGGRNAEFLLALELALAGLPGVAAIACDTDGIDGIEDNAGAWFDNDRPIGASARPDPRAHLADNDAYGYFAALGQLVMTGPTRTNVNDFRAILIR